MKTPAQIVAELRRQHAQRHATWPCLRLADLMPLCAAYEAAEAEVRRLRAAADRIDMRAGICKT